MVNINKLVKTLVTESLLQQKDVLERLSKHREFLKKQFLIDCLQELKIKTLPKVIFTKDKYKTETLGHNNLNDNQIVVFTMGRNMADCFRTISHELVHSKQNCDGRIDQNSGDTGSDIENEANSQAGIFLRDFGKKYPEIYQLSFDNELNEEGNYDKYQTLLKIRYPTHSSEGNYANDREKIYNQTVKKGGNIDSWNRIVANDQNRFVTEEKDFGFRTGNLEGDKPEDMQRMDSNRSTGHFGTGYYFFGDEDSAKDYQKNSGGRDVRIVDFSKYNLFKIPSKEFGFRLHDFFKKFNNNDFQNSGRIKSYDLITYDNISNYFKNNIIEFNLYELRDILQWKEYFESYLYDFNKNELIKSFSKKSWDSEEDLKLIKNIISFLDNVVKPTIKKNLIETFSNDVLPFLKVLNGGNSLDESQQKDLIKIIFSDLRIKRNNDKRNLMIGKDTLSTRIMKYFGYEGVDVRGINGLDNSQYGSVIYDIKQDSIIKESKETNKHEYGCLMLDVPFQNWQKVLSRISKEDLYEEEDDDSYGLETEPHVTVLYGLHEEVEDEKLIDFVKEFCKSSPIEIQISKMGVFKNSKFEVLKFDVESSTLKSLNKQISENFPYTTKFPTYEPHITIAYLKKGTCQKYLKELKEPVSKSLKTFVYSKVDGSEPKFKIN
jgi:hypothetical protein